jgi:hypothetical protein
MDESDDVVVERSEDLDLLRNRQAEAAQGCAGLRRSNSTV